MGFSNWLPELPFGISGTNSRGESSTGAEATTSGASVDDDKRNSEEEEQQMLAVDPNAIRVTLAMEPQLAFSIDAGQELPRLNVPQPYVNPLADMQDRPDPALSGEERKEAYAQFMERFQAGDPDVCHPQSP